ncbi:MAG: divergent polysaccharide deacetylase family protein [Pseudomonadota bacterium]
MSATHPNLPAMPMLAAQRQNRPRRTQIVRRTAGRAGLLASIAMAFLGMGAGALASFVGGHNSQSAAFPDFGSSSLPRVAFDPVVDHAVTRLREGNRGDIVFVPSTSEKIVGGLSGETPGATAVSTTPVIAEAVDTANAQPRIAIVFDDVGLDPGVFDTLLTLPGPVTHSFLAYAPDISAMAPRASALGHGVLLHLPMEPVGPEDPGPRALTTGASPSAFRRNLAWNLDQLAGYSGVNNHMGSRLTANRGRMTAVMRALRDRQVYFLDSVTSPRTVGAQIAAREGTLYLRRDVFLDPEAGRETVRQQLAQTEAIARRSGFAIAIAHPRPDTIAVIGPWLASAKARGFTLVTTDDLVVDLYNLDPDLFRRDHHSEDPPRPLSQSKTTLRG